MAERLLDDYSTLTWRPSHWFLTVTLLGLAVSAVGCAAPLTGSRPAAPVQPPALRPTTAQTQPVEATPSPAADPPLQVRRPVPGSSVGAPIQIEGTARLAEGAVAAIVRNDLGKELGRASTTPTAEASARGAFALEVAFPRSAGGQSAFLEVFTISARDGSVQHVTRIPVQLVRE